MQIVGEIRYADAKSKGVKNSSMSDGDILREFIGEDGHFSTKFDFSAHVLSYGEHGWYDAPARLAASGVRNHSGFGRGTDRGTDCPFRKTAQIQSADNQSLEITQEVPAQFQNVAKTSSY